jgi:hypothetical protein
MRKSTVFISAVLTTFAIAMLYGIVSAYQGATNVAEAAAAPTATLAPEATDAPVPTQPTLTPEAAAQLAAQILGNSNLLSAESANFNGLNAYMITFTNNDVVYVGLDGQILSVQIAPMVVNVAAPVPSQQNHIEKHKSEGNHESSEHED